MEDLMDPDLIRENVKDSLVRYVQDGCPTGHFLHAVLSNNLTEAIGRADDYNLRTLPAIVSYCYNEIPDNCWGSPEKVDIWLKKKAEERKVIRAAALALAEEESREGYGAEMAAQAEAEGRGQAGGGPEGP